MFILERGTNWIDVLCGFDNQKIQFSLLPTLYENGADAFVNSYGMGINFFPTLLRLYPLVNFIRIKENENVWNQHDLPCSILVLSFLLFSLEACFLILPKGNVDVIKKERKSRTHKHLSKSAFQYM